jgi:hypothetical protein
MKTGQFKSPQDIKAYLISVGINMTIRNIQLMLHSMGFKAKRKQESDFISESNGGHTDTRNCCTITRTGSGLVDDLRYLLMGIFLAAVMFSGYVYPFKWLFPIFKTAKNIWNAGDILDNRILLHPVIH